MIHWTTLKRNVALAFKQAVEYKEELKSVKLLIKDIVDLPKVSVAGKGEAAPTATSKKILPNGTEPIG